MDNIFVLVGVKNDMQTDIATSQGDRIRDWGWDLHRDSNSHNRSHTTPLSLSGVGFKATETWIKFPTYSYQLCEHEQIISFLLASATLLVN